MPNGPNDLSWQNRRRSIDKQSAVKTVTIRGIPSTFPRYVMKIAVTGCNGLVGQRVVLRALRTGHIVVGVDNVAKEDTEFRHDPRFVFVPADLTSFEEALEAFQGCDAIMQLAAISQPMDYKVNTHNR